jgi:hypothetical protein
MSVEQRTALDAGLVQRPRRIPAEAIGNACRKWRHSGQTKFPTAGLSCPMVREGPARPSERAAGVERWRELSEAEYQALTVREKIRHHQILAHAA